MRAISNFDTGFPNMRGRITPAAATAGRDARPAGLVDVLCRQVAPCPDHGGVDGRAVPQLAAPEGLRSVLRLHAGRDRSLPSRPVRRQSPIEQPADTRGGLPPQRGSGRPGHLDDSQPALVGAREAVPAVPAVRSDPCSAPCARQSISRKYRGFFDEGWDVFRDRVHKTTDRPRNHPARHRTRAPQSGCAALGRSRRDRTSLRLSPSRGVCGDPRSHRRPDRPSPRLPRTAWHRRRHARLCHERQRRLTGRQ